MPFKLTTVVNLTNISKIVFLLFWVKGLFWPDGNLCLVPVMILGNVK